MAKKKFGFSGIYHDLINELTMSWLWKVAGPGILIILAVLVAINLGMLTGVDKTLLANFSDLTTALLMLFIVLAILFGVVFGVMANLSGIKYGTSTLTAKIVIVSQHPFSDDTGLAYDDLQHLKAIGQVEQSAAGWQGGLLSFAVVWFLADNIGLFTTQFNLLVSASQKAGKLHYFNWESLGWSLAWLLALLIIGSIAFIVFKFIYDFLGNEPANRAIIKACEDAQALLRTLELVNTKKLAIKDKRKIAELCECLYISQNKISKYKYRKSFKSVEVKNKNFALIVSPRLRVERSSSHTSKEK